MALRPTMAHLSEDSPRAAQWRTIFGGTELPLVSLIPLNGFTPDGKEARFYQVDWKKLKEPVLELLIGHVSEKFKLTREEVLESLNDPAHGFPILAEDVAVAFDARLIL